MNRALSRSFLILASIGLIASCSELPTGPDSSRELGDDMDWLTASGAMVNGDYVIQDLGTLGGVWSQAYGVNDNGWIVGASRTETGVLHAFVWTESGGMQDINGPGWFLSNAESVNDNGMVVGWGIKDGEGIRGFYWTAEAGMLSIGVPSLHTSSYCFNVNDAGEIVGMALGQSGWDAVVWMTPSSVRLLGSLGGTASRGLDINEVGHVAGKSTLSDGSNRAVLWVPQNPMLNLGTLGGAGSEAFGVNESSQAVGWAHDAVGNERPFYWDGDMHDLGTLGGPSGEAYEISDDGVIVGHSQDASGSTRPTEWADGDVIDLGTLDGGPGEARDVNGSGMVVGFGEVNSGDTHAMAWTPAVQPPPPPPPPAVDPIEELKGAVDELVDSGALNGGQANALLVKIETAEKKMESKPNAAINALNAFINQVEAFARTGRLSEEEATELIGIAEQLIAELENG